MEFIATIFICLLSKLSFNVHKKCVYGVRSERPFSSLAWKQSNARRTSLLKMSFATNCN